MARTPSIIIGGKEFPVFPLPPQNEVSDVVEEDILRPATPPETNRPRKFSGFNAGSSSNIPQPSHEIVQDTVFEDEVATPAEKDKTLWDEIWNTGKDAVNKVGDWLTPEEKVNKISRLAMYQSLFKQGGQTPDPNIDASQMFNVDMDMNDELIATGLLSGSVSVTENGDLYARGQQVPFARVDVEGKVVPYDFQTTSKSIANRLLDTDPNSILSNVVTVIGAGVTGLAAPNIAKDLFLKGGRLGADEVQGMHPNNRDKTKSFLEGMLNFYGSQPDTYINPTAHTAGSLVNAIGSSLLTGGAGGAMSMGRTGIALSASVPNALRTSYDAIEGRISPQSAGLSIAGDVGANAIGIGAAFKGGNATVKEAVEQTPWKEGLKSFATPKGALDIGGATIVGTLGQAGVIADESGITDEKELAEALAVQAIATGTISSVMRFVPARNHAASQKKISERLSQDFNKINKVVSDAMESKDAVRIDVIDEAVNKILATNVDAGGKAGLKKDEYIKAINEYARSIKADPTLNLKDVELSVGDDGAMLVNIKKQKTTQRGSSTSGTATGGRRSVVTDSPMEAPGKYSTPSPIADATPDTPLQQAIIADKKVAKDYGKKLGKYNIGNGGEITPESNLRDLNVVFDQYTGGEGADELVKKSILDGLLTPENSHTVKPAYIDWDNRFNVTDDSPYGGVVSSMSAQWRAYLRTGPEDLLPNETNGTLRMLADNDLGMMYDALADAAKVGEVEPDIIEALTLGMNRKQFIDKHQNVSPKGIAQKIDKKLGEKNTSLKEVLDNANHRNTDEMNLPLSDADARIDVSAEDTPDVEVVSNLDPSSQSAIGTDSPMPSVEAQVLNDRVTPIQDVVSDLGELTDDPVLLRNLNNVLKDLNAYNAEMNNPASTLTPAQRDEQMVNIMNALDDVKNKVFPNADRELTAQSVIALNDFAVARQNYIADPENPANIKAYQNAQRKLNRLVAKGDIAPMDADRGLKQKYDKMNDAIKDIRTRLKQDAMVRSKVADDARTKQNEVLRKALDAELAMRNDQLNDAIEDLDLLEREFSMASGLLNPESMNVEDVPAFVNRRNKLNSIRAELQDPNTPASRVKELQDEMYNMSPDMHNVEGAKFDVATDTPAGQEASDVISDGLEASVRKPNDDNPLKARRTRLSKKMRQLERAMDRFDGDEKDAKKIQKLKDQIKEDTDKVKDAEKRLKETGSSVQTDADEEAVKNAHKRDIGTAMLGIGGTLMEDDDTDEFNQASIPYWAYWLVLAGGLGMAPTGRKMWLGRKANMKRLAPILDKRGYVKDLVDEVMPNVSKKSAKSKAEMTQAIIDNAGTKMDNDLSKLIDGVEFNNPNGVVDKGINRDLKNRQNRQAVQTDIEFRKNANNILGKSNMSVAMSEEAMKQKNPDYVPGTLFSLRFNDNNNFELTPVDVSATGIENLKRTLRAMGANASRKVGAVLDMLKDKMGGEAETAVAWGTGNSLYRQAREAQLGHAEGYYGKEELARKLNLIFSPENIENTAYNVLFDKSINGYAPNTSKGDELIKKVVDNYQLVRSIQKLTTDHDVNMKMYATYGKPYEQLLNDVPNMKDRIDELKDILDKIDLTDPKANFTEYRLMRNELDGLTYVIGDVEDATNKMIESATIGYVAGNTVNSDGKGGMLRIHEVSETPDGKYVRTGEFDQMRVMEFTDNLSDARDAGNEFMAKYGGEHIGGNYWLVDKVGFDGQVKTFTNADGVEQPVKVIVEMVSNDLETLRETSATALENASQVLKNTAGEDIFTSKPRTKVATDLLTAIGDIDFDGLDGEEASVLEEVRGLATRLLNANQQEIDNAEASTMMGRITQLLAMKRGNRWTKSNNYYGGLASAEGKDFVYNATATPYAQLELINNSNEHKALVQKLTYNTDVMDANGIDILNPMYQHQKQMLDNLQMPSKDNIVTKTSKGFAQFLSLKVLGLNFASGIRNVSDALIMYPAVASWYGSGNPFTTLTKLGYNTAKFAPEIFKNKAKKKLKLPPNVEPNTPEFYEELAKQTDSFTDRLSDFNMEGVSQYIEAGDWASKVKIPGYALLRYTDAVTRKATALSEAMTFMKANEHKYTDPALLEADALMHGTTIADLVHGRYTKSDKNTLRQKLMGETGVEFLDTIMGPFFHTLGVFNVMAKEAFITRGENVGRALMSTMYMAGLGTLLGGIERVPMLADAYSFLKYMSSMTSKEDSKLDATPYEAMWNDAIMTTANQLGLDPDEAALLKKYVEYGVISNVFGVDLSMHDQVFDIPFVADQMLDMAEIMQRSGMENKIGTFAYKVLSPKPLKNMFDTYAKYTGEPNPLTGKVDQRDHNWTSILKAILVGQDLDQSLRGRNKFVENHSFELPIEREEFVGTLINRTGLSLGGDNKEKGRLIAESRVMNANAAAMFNDLRDELRSPKLLNAQQISTDEIEKYIKANAEDVVTKAQGDKVNKDPALSIKRQSNQLQADAIEYYANLAAAKVVNDYTKLDVDTKHIKVTPTKEMEEVDDYPYELQGFEYAKRKFEKSIGKEPTLEEQMKEQERKIKRAIRKGQQVTNSPAPDVKKLLKQREDLIKKGLNKR